MKNLFFVLLFFLGINPIFSQCKQYIESIAESSLSPYISDGNFYTPVVTEGDYIKFTRTFLGGKHYKIVILGMDFLEKEITIKDQDGIVIFANYPSRKTGEGLYYTDYKGNKVSCLGSNEFEFVLNNTQNLLIEVAIEKKAKRKKYRLKGCLGIVVGFKE